MGDLKDGPQGFVLLFAVGGGVLGVAHFVGVGEKGVFDVVEAGGGRFFGFGGADRWHFVGGGVGERCDEGGCRVLV